MSTPPLRSIEIKNSLHLTHEEKDHIREKIKEVHSKAVQLVLPFSPSPTHHEQKNIRNREMLQVQLQNILSDLTDISIYVSDREHRMTASDRDFTRPILHGARIVSNLIQIMWNQIALEVEDEEIAE